MNEDDSVRYAVAMQAYIRHLAETLKFWQEREPEQEECARRKLRDFMNTYRRNEVRTVYERIRREVQTILNEDV